MSMPDFPTGAVTTADIYRSLEDINKGLMALNSQVEVLGERSRTSDTAHTDYEKRIRILEAERYKVRAWATTVGGIAGIITGILSSFAGHVH